MKLTLSRSTVLFCGIYTLVLGAIMVVLSILSIVANRCTFVDGFSTSPESYFFHLFYYRSTHCDSFVDWSILGLEGSEQLNELIEMPDQNSLVARTYKLSLIQLIISSLLVFVSMIALATLAFDLYFISRKISYAILFVPYLLVLHVSIVFDFVAGTLYADDRLRSYSIDGTMTMLGITNPNVARPFIEQIAETSRILAPNVMFYISTKAMIINIASVVFLFFMVFAGWEVVDGNKLRKTKKDDS